MAVAQEDIRLALEAGYSARAAGDVAVITAAPGAQQAIAESAGGLAAEAAAHKAAVGALGVDLSETEDARAGLGAARQDAIRRYAFVRSTARQRLLTIDPDQGPPLSPAEQARRENGLARTLGLNASDLQERSTRDLVARLDVVTEALRSDPLLKDLGLLQSLEPSVGALRHASDTVDREIGEDRAAYALLESRRSTLQRKLSAHRLWVEAALVDADRRSELGRYVLAADAAYAARRQAGKPVSEEPGAQEAASSLTPATPVADPIQPPAG